MDYFILPLTKNPDSKHQVGPTEKQDWYKGLREAVSLQKELPRSKILIISDVTIDGGSHEADLYVSVLKKLGMKECDLVVVKQAQETIEQIDIALEIARAEKKGLIVISTFLHYLRVGWLLRSAHVPIEHYPAFGIPRPRQAIMDIALTFLFPIIDVCGGRDWFKKRVHGRRVDGKY